jgi:hypothetical protein
VDAPLVPGDGPGSPWGALLRGPRLGRVVLALLVAVAGAVAAAVLGLGTWRAVTVGVAVTGAGAVLAALPRQVRVGWAVEPAPGSEGGRSELLYLSLALQPRGGRVSQTGLARVQALGRDRLRRRGLHLDQEADGPAVEHLVGRTAAAVLVWRGDPLPALPAVRECLARLEALSPAGAAAAPAPATAPAGEGAQRAGAGRRIRRTHARRTHAR